MIYGEICVVQKYMLCFERHIRAAGCRFLGAALNTDQDH